MQRTPSDCRRYASSVAVIAVIVAGRALEAAGRRVHDSTTGRTDRPASESAIWRIVSAGGGRDGKQCDEGKVAEYARHSNLQVETEHGVALRPKPGRGSSATCELARRGNSQAPCRFRYRLSLNFMDLLCRCGRGAPMGDMPRASPTAMLKRSRHDSTMGPGFQIEAMPRGPFDGSRLPHQPASISPYTLIWSRFRRRRSSTSSGGSAEHDG